MIKASTSVEALFGYLGFGVLYCNVYYIAVGKVELYAEVRVVLFADNHMIAGGNDNLVRELYLSGE